MAEHPALVAAAAVGLSDRLDAVCIAPADAGRVLATAELDRLGGFLGRAVRHGLVSCDHDTAEAVELLWHRQLTTCVVTEALAVRVACALDDAGVVWRITKGPALAHLDYRDPSLRTFGDVDVIVHPDCWSNALTVLGDLGLRRDVPELRKGFDTRFGKGATLADPSGHEVDLHIRFAVGRFGITSRMQDVFESVEPLPLGGRTLPALAPTDRMLHACYHASLGGFRHLRALRDVAQLALITEVPWIPVVEQARRWRAEAVVARAVTDCWNVFGLDCGHDFFQWAIGHRSTALEQKVIELFAREEPFRRQALTSLPVLPWIDRPRFLWALTGQARDLDGRTRTLPSRVWSAVRTRARR